MKKVFFISAAIAVCCFLVTACPADNILSQEGLQLVSALDLGSTIPVPVSGQVIPYDITISHSQYTGNVTWIYSSGAPVTDEFFLHGTVYNAVVLLTAINGFTFNGIAADSFTSTGAASVSNPANTGRITVNYPATGALAQVVNAYDLSDLIEFAETGGSPQTALDSTQYTGNIAWLEEDGSPFTGIVFDAEEKYTAHVTLVAKEGFTFMGISANVFIFDKPDAAIEQNNRHNHWVVTISFPVTAPQVVSLLDLSLLVNPPVRGITPQAEVQSNQYSGNITWLDDDTPFIENAFEPETVYTARIELTRKHGYTFAGLAGGSFSHNSADSVSNEQDSGIVTIVFPATLDAGTDAPVTMRDLTALIPVPVLGQTPVDSFTGHFNQYTGDITWQDEEGTALSGVFTGYTVYKATVTLTATTGYTFIGIAEDSFIHDGAESINNAADSGEITIIFPRTGVMIVDDFDLAVYIETPQPGGSPVTSFTGPQYTGSVQWTDSQDNTLIGNFGYGLYRAIVTLTSVNADQYTFTGLAANRFSHVDATSVINAANSGVVTLVFMISPYLELPLTAIQGCCWCNNEPPSRLIDGNLNSRWAYAWQTPDGGNESSWLDALYPDRDDGGLQLTNVEGSNGHAQALAEFDLVPSHFFTIDLGTGNEIYYLEYYHTDARRFNKGEIYISDNPLGVNPSESEKLGDFSFETVPQNTWMKVDLAEMNGGDAITKRYLQIRFTEGIGTTMGLDGVLQEIQFSMSP